MLKLTSAGSVELLKGSIPKLGTAQNWKGQEPALKEGKRQKSNFLCGQRDITKTQEVQIRTLQGASSCPEGCEQFSLSLLKYEELKPDESREAP